MNLNFSDNLTVGTSICLALCLPPLTTSFTNVLTNYMDAFNKELRVETTALRKSDEDAKADSEKPKKRETETSCVKNQSFVSSDEGVEEEIPYSVQHVESLDEDKMSSDSCAVEVQVGYNVEILAKEATENKPSAEDVNSVTDIRENEQVQELVRTTDKGCKSNAALRIHRLCCHSSVEEKRLCCEHCGKAYALKRSLDLHMAKLHTGVRYPCTHCDKLFRSASSLTRHDLTHTQGRPYSCSECSMSFRSASELKVHTRHHTGERLFQCQECGKGFVQSYYLTAHMRMHTREKPYKCPTCDKCFKSAGILKRHQMTHTGEKPHKCSACEMAFSWLEFVKAHMRKFH